MQINSLLTDPRVIEAKKLLHEAILDQQKDLKGIRPPQSSFIQDYAETIKQFNEIRGGNLYFPYIGSGRGKGPLVELLDGSVKYDMITGIGPHFWGHSHWPLMEAAIDGVLSDTIMQGHLQQNQDTYLLSKLLTQASGMDHCFLSSSGAMANENALKIAFQYKSPAARILSFNRCFMGRSLALAQITDKPANREGLPTTFFVDYIPYYDANDPGGSTKAAIKALRELLARYPNQHAAMCFELIQGEAGFNRGTTTFFSEIMEELKQRNIPILIDEVQTFGRTPQLFAFQYLNLEKYVDIVTIGKMAQVCATLFKTNLKPKPGLLSQTFTSSSAAISASYWIIKHLLASDYYGPKGQLVRLHERFETHFKRIENMQQNYVQGPYGIGGMIIFTPLGGEAKRVAKFVQDLFQAGVISFIAGSNPTKVRFLIPAGVMTEADVDSVISIVEKVLKTN